MADPDPWAAFNPQPVPSAGSPADSLGRPVIVKGQSPTPATESYSPMTPAQREQYGIPAGVPVVINQAGKPQVISIPKDNATADALSPDALDAETTNWILTGKMSPLGMGNGPLRVQIENNRPVIMKKYGITDNALPAVRQQFDADSKAYSQRTQQLSFMKQSLDAAQQHVTQIGQYLNELPAQTSITPLNAISNAVQRGVSGDTISQLDATMPLLQGEVAKIMTANPSGSGQLTDEARREFDILNSSRSPAARKEAMDAIMEMVNRKINGTQAESDRLNQRLNGGLQSYALGGMGAPPAAPGAGPSLGAPTPPGSPPQNPIANGGPGDMGPSLAPSGGETRSVVDPKKQALGQQIVSLVSKGANPNTVMGFATGVDPTLRGDPKFRAWVAQAVQYRQQHPGAKFSIDPGFYTTEAPLSAVEKVGNAVAQSGPGAAAMNAANAVTAGNLGNITGDREGVNRALAVANAQHPMASLAGSAAGGAAAALGLDGALAKAGVASLPAAIGADMGYGGIAGATNAPNGQALQNGAIGALLGLGGNLAGRGIGKAAGAVAQGVTNPSVSYVAREVPQSLTIGQAVGQSGIAGRAVKGIEDRLSGIPVVGDAINARRLEGLQKMNSVAFDKALEPIGAKSSGKFGEQAVADAQDTVSQAFSKALGGKVASVDQGFIADAAKAKSAIKALPPSISKDVENHVDTAIRDYVDPNSLSISGENMQALLRDLQQVKKGYRSDPAGYRVGKAIDQMTDSIENLFRRQAPDVMPQYDAAKQAFKRVSTLEDAVLRAKNTNGIFTPGQLGLADRANTVAYGGKHAAAAGKGEFHDFQRNMQEVLPNKVPDSGTAGRLVLPALAIGAGAGGGELSGNESTGLTLGGLIAAAYTRSGQRALTSLVLKRGASAKAVGNAVTKAAPVLGHAAGTQAALGASRD